MASFAPIRGTRTQIRNTPIVDGQFLVETDQGVDNMIYIDEGSTRTMVGGNTVTGVLPELYIYSETGSTVTVEDSGGNLIPLSQIGTDHWICQVPDYGVYTVYSVLSGETITKAINVTDCMIYTIDDSHFHNNIVVTYPSGANATCQCVGGGENLSAPALNPPDTSYTFVVHGKSTVYTITVNANGAIKTATVTTSNIVDDTFSVAIPFAEVDLIVEVPPITGNIVCTDSLSTTTITIPVASRTKLCIPDVGDWTITYSDGTNTFHRDITITSLTDRLQVNLNTAPDGATVTPINDIQTWLNCAGIYDKTTYSTVKDVIEDKDTLAILIKDNNAVDYMVRSNNFTDDGLVPVMTSNTSPSGIAFAGIGNSSSEASGYEAYKAFNKIPSDTSRAATTQTAGGYYIGYVFPSATSIKKVRVKGETGYDITWKVQYSSDTTTGLDGTWIDASDTFITNNATSNTVGVLHNVNYVEAIVDVNTSAVGWRIISTAVGGTSNMTLSYLQFCASTKGIINDEVAMEYVGRKNYCATTLLEDSIWDEAIVNSVYIDNVLNVSIPAMTDATHPSGTVSSNNAQTSYPAYCAFDKNVLTRWVPLATSIVSGGVYVEYDFGKNVRFYGTANNSFGYPSSTGSALTAKLQVYNTNISDWEDITSFNMQPFLGWWGNKSFSPIVGNKVRYFCSSYGTTGSYYMYGQINLMNFYGREDVNESEIEVFSAANDTVYYVGTSGNVTVCTTDSTGRGTVAKSDLPNGSYVFYSSVAKDPDNTSNFYHTPTMTVNGNTMALYIMPENTLYWWGYKNAILEPTINQYGWNPNATYMTTLNLPTYNVDGSVLLYGASGQGSGLGTKVQVTDVDTAYYIVVTGYTSAASKDTSGYSMLGSTKESTNWTGYKYVNPPYSTTLAKYTSTDNTSTKNHGYAVSYGGAGRGQILYAFFYD